MACLARTAITIALLLLVLEPMSCAGDFLSPLLSPVMGEVCKAVECGKGQCKAVENGTFDVPYRCECDPGWNHTLDSRHFRLQFLPCVIPNCTLYNSCTAAPSPVPQKSPDDDDDNSIFNICHSVYCGGGSCNRTSVFTHSCECEAGYNNLLNVSAFPCFRDCEIGVDCANLGILLPNNTSSATTPSENANSRASTNVVQNSWWLLAMSVGLLIGQSVL